MPSVYVTLVGGSPWGFRIQGGRGTGQPLRLSKVNPGSKAFHQGLLEGDLLKMVNGYLTDGLSQMDVQNIIKETGTSLTLEVARDLIREDRPKTFTTKKTLILNGTHKANSAHDDANSVPVISKPRLQNGSSGYRSPTREYSSPLPNGKSPEHNGRSHMSSNTIITDEPPPPGAILIEKKVTVDGDKVHTDKYYAIPVKEVLREKTTTTKFIPAPPKYEGIGPTEEGVPIGLRNSVKKENVHNWYKTMYKSLHKADTSNDTQEYIIGYSSEPEIDRKDKIMQKRTLTLDNRLKNEQGLSNHIYKQDYHRPSAKSSIEVYNVRPRLIEDYEPGYSSVTDNDKTTYSKRYLPAPNTPKPSYEFKNGYEPDNNFIKNFDQPQTLDAEQQKANYIEIQRGGEVPSFGLGKPAPVKPSEPIIGPLPPPPLHYFRQTTHRQATRPLTLPLNYGTENANGVCQQMNGAYEMQMRNAIHSEMQHRMSPSNSPQHLSPPIRSMVKSPSKSPDIRLPAQVLFDFSAETPKEISLKKGEIVLVLRQLDKNWYEGECHGIVGIFPISYVEILPPEHVVSSIKMDGIGKALYDFQAQTSIELSVKKGDTITLVRRVDANWYEARLSTRKGIIPASYIQVMQEPSESSMGSPSSKSLNSSPRSVSETRERLPKPVSNPSSPYSPSTPSPQTIANMNGKVLTRSKKGSSLIEPVLYRAVYSYNPQNSDELELLEGDTVYVVEMCDDGWYVGTSVRTGIFGIFPGNYVEKV